MPNRNYIKGVKKERKIVNDARSKGFIAFRSAGSHSPIDVCIIDLEGHKIEFIQCKPDNYSQNSKFKLEEALMKLNHFFEVSFKVK